MPALPTRDDAWALLCEYTQNESLRKHALAVEACVLAYARIPARTRISGASPLSCTISITNAGQTTPTVRRKNTRLAARQSCVSVAIPRK